MSASISITNIRDNMVLGPDFTVCGDFSASYGPKTSGSKTTYALVRSLKAASARAVISVKCHLKTGAGAAITSIDGFVDPSNTRWQANFVGQAAGRDLQLVPELTVDTSSFTGSAVVGLEIRALARIPITITPTPVGPTPPGSRREALSSKYLKPEGGITIPGSQVASFLSIIVIDGIEVSPISTKDFEVNNARHTWSTKTKKHGFTTGGHASHVIYLAQTSGEKVTTSRKL